MGRKEPDLKKRQRSRVTKSKGVISSNVLLSLTACPLSSSLSPFFLPFPLLSLPLSGTESIYASKYNYLSGHLQGTKLYRN